MVAAGKGPGVPRLSVPASVAAPVTAPVTTAFDRRASAEAEFAQAALAFAEVAQAEAAEAAAEAAGAPWVAGVAEGTCENGSESKNRNVKRTRTRK